MTDIKAMVNRFLSWQLPDDFSPDNGISFHPWIDPTAPGPGQVMGKRLPTGTNLFNAQQAEAMIRHMLYPSPAELVDLIGELGRAVFNLIDNCETSGPKDAEVHTITEEDLTRVSALLDQIEALPFSGPNEILGPGAMLQEAIGQLFEAKR